MHQRHRDRNELIVSYLFLRQAMGWIGALLPIVLLAGNAISSATPRPDSVSGYYYTDMRNTLVGALCALGVFLVAYKGYDDVDLWITNIAGLGAIGVAFCPTKPAVCTPGIQACLASSVARLSTSQQVVGDIHVFFAAVTFIALGLMALRFAKRGVTPAGHSTISQLRYGLGFGKPDNVSQRQQYTGRKCRLPCQRHYDLVLRAPGGAVESAAGLGQRALAIAVHLRVGRDFRVRSLLVRERPDDPGTPGPDPKSQGRNHVQRPGRGTGTASGTVSRGPAGRTEIRQSPRSLILVSRPCSAG